MEDADSTRPDQQANDDQDDPGQRATANDRHDAGDHQDYGDKPKQRIHAKGIPPIACA